MGIRRPVTPDTKCGCYYCLKIFLFKEIKEYTDNGLTPLCPYCGIDSVRLDAPGTPVTDEELKKAHREGFGTS
jgi:NAD-dependent SIR2 family protein deacetylase